MAQKDEMKAVPAQETDFDNAVAVEEHQSC